MHFPTDYKSILERIDEIDPVSYGKTRNYIDGAVTGLSPYISRGVISTRQVLERVLQKGYTLSQIIPFVKELCWRDYFQRVGQVKELNREIRQAQVSVRNHEIPSRVVQAATGIEGIDSSIRQLYQTGYMHNHCRMYTASLVCNIARSHWYHPAQWMYYYLLDGDWASNACSWQWVAGANSSKKYYANQENINKYTYTNQVNTCLDKPYEMLETMEIPAAFLPTVKFDLPVLLPAENKISLNKDEPTFLYNYYNLDPAWHAAITGNRILLIEPAFFSQYPVADHCIRFMLALSSNIPGIQIHIGSFSSFVDKYRPADIYYKEHPLMTGYTGRQEERDWIVPEVTGYYPSFFTYWKKIEKRLSTLKTAN
jgi:deoxyribodipyrimidine photo-lyase